MPSGDKSYRGLKICCGATALIFIIVLVIFGILFLTVFKPKQPQIDTNAVYLEHIELGVFPVITLDLTLGIEVTVTNRNYGSFKYKNTTAYIYYHGSLVAEAPIEEDTVPARGKHNISTSVEIFGDKLIANPYFLVDFTAGNLNFTSSTTLHGKAIVFKILKMDATAYNHCDMAVFIKSQHLESKCNSKVKF